MLNPILALFHHETSALTHNLAFKVPFLMSKLVYFMSNSSKVTPFNSHSFRTGPQNIGPTQKTILSLNQYFHQGKIPKSILNRTQLIKHQFYNLKTTRIGQSRNAFYILKYSLTIQLHRIFTSPLLAKAEISNLLISPCPKTDCRTGPP